MSRRSVVKPEAASVPISKEVFKAEVAAWAQKMKVEPKELHVRPMSRKWGSCSTAGRVSFSLELLAEPYQVHKGIIVHELLHLKVPNHGKLFKALLKAYTAVTTPLPEGGGFLGEAGPRRP
jgi:predicted metal-dependent hydrolase